MKLAELVELWPSLDEDLTIFAKRPWGPSSKCATARLEPAEKVPRHLLDTGLDYFLEVHVGNEVFEVFEKVPPTSNQKIELLIYYAENDAFPDWVYEQNTDRI